MYRSVCVCVWWNPRMGKSEWIPWNYYVLGLRCFRENDFFHYSFYTSFYTISFKNIYFRMNVINSSNGTIQTNITKNDHVLNLCFFLECMLSSLFVRHIGILSFRNIYFKFIMYIYVWWMSSSVKIKANIMERS